MSNKIFDTFLYTDERRIKTYLYQFAESKLNGEKIKGLGKSMIKNVESLNTFQLINLFENILRENGLVHDKRPKEMSIEEILTKNKFVYEVIPATRLIFKKDILSPLHTVDLVTVWVSDPPLYDLSKDKRFFTGSFLYLTQNPVFDYSRYTSSYSGKSALNILYKSITGKEFFVSQLSKKQEPLGRSSYKHPVRKLEEIGAIQEGVEFIEVLYDCRYISNEQCFIYNKRRKRVCDLLGYPIYIKQV